MWVNLDSNQHENSIFTAAANFDTKKKIREKKYSLLIHTSHRFVVIISGNHANLDNLPFAALFFVTIVNLRKTQKIN